ncbi:uncharacterized protein LOC126326560 [Schistocerca gregaria]|uniref:uncharacterized protein LOC126326560 n=1 Tax=Schistocerca gregaria TaxID=7010 RepID=UPI00211E2081|nr:uncharacterized protein LOC126326560 [Schistocerca gregaria]
MLLTSRHLSKRLGHPRSYSLDHSPLSFSLHHVNHRHLDQVKRDRFGEELELFKKRYEEPLVKLFELSQRQKNLARKTLRNRASAKDYRSRLKIRREANAKKLQDDDDDQKLKKGIELILDKTEPSMTKFLSGTDRAKTLFDHGNPLEDLDMRFDAFDLEGKLSKSWCPAGYLRAEFMQQRFKTAPDRWRFEKHLPYAEWIKVIKSDLLNAGLPTPEENEQISEFQQQLELEFDQVELPALTEKKAAKYTPVDIDSPAVSEPSYRPAAPEKTRKPIVYFEQNCPFVIETKEKRPAKHHQGAHRPHSSRLLPKKGQTLHRRPPTRPA